MKNTSKIKGVTMTKQEKIKKSIISFLAKHGEQSQSAILRQLDLIESDRTARRAIAELIADNALKARFLGGKKLLKISENLAEPSISENQVVKETFLKTIKPLTRNGASIFYLAHTPKKTAEPSTKAGAKNSPQNAELFERVELCEYSIDNIQEKIAKIDEFSKKLDKLENMLNLLKICLDKQGLQIHKHQELLGNCDDRLLEIEMNDLIKVRKRLDKHQELLENCNDSIALSNAEFLAINERFEALESADNCETSAEQDQDQKAEKSRFLGLFQ